MERKGRTTGQSLSSKGNNKRKLLYLLGLCPFFFFTLQGSPAQEQPQNELSVREEVSIAVKDSTSTLFPQPAIPLTIDKPSQQALYYLKHYWDAFDFTQGKEVLQDAKSKKKLEKEFCDFLTIALSLPLNKVKETLMTPAKQAEGELFYYFEELYSHYLHDAGAPYKNELYYVEVLKWYLHSPKTDFATMERTKSTLKLILRNSVGEQAENFSFVLTSGEVRQLSQYRGKLLLLLFYTPGCEGCRKATRQLKGSWIINQDIAKEKLHLLYIYPENNPEELKKDLSMLPSNAAIGVNSNEEIISSSLYDLSQSPTIYLLDAKGKVLLKNTTIKTIEKFLQNKNRIRVGSAPL